MMTRPGVRGLLLVAMLGLYGWGAKLTALPSYSTDGLIIEIGLDTHALRIGEQTQLHMHVQGDWNVEEVGIKAFYEIEHPGIEILALLESDTNPSLDGPGFRIHHTYLITSFDTGIHEINPLAFIIMLDGRPVYLITDPVSLVVTTLGIDPEADIKDIKANFDFPLTFREILQRILLISFILAVIVFALYLYKQYRRGKPLVAVFRKVELPPHTRALQAFEELRKKKLWQQGRIKDFHSELTDILRTYIEDRYGIPALEMVTADILWAFEQEPDLQVHRGDIAKVLAQADLVKFAKAQPLPDEHEKGLQLSIAFVKATTPSTVMASGMPGTNNTLPDAIPLSNQGSV